MSRSQVPSQTQTQTIQKLDFADKLIQPGKRETSDLQLKRLKTLHQRLAALEQDYIEVRSLDSVRKQLIDRTILHHKDRGVKAYAACCLADLLRLYAPDAPYTADELRDIFQFFITQITLNLKTAPPVRPLQPSKSKSNAADSHSQTQPQASQRITEVAYYSEYYYLLESLSTIKSVVLVCDVPGGDELVTTIFEGFVELVRSDMSRTLIRHLINILVALLEECSSVPSGVMDCIVSQFENFASRPETPSFHLVVEVCNRVPDRLQRYMLGHFTEIQLAHGRDPSPQDIKALADSHALLLSIYRNSPALLLNVVPLLEENLRVADEIFIRQLSTKTLGTMFGERVVVGTGVADIAKAYPNAWKAWLGRKVDKALQVRLAWVEAARGVLVNHPGLRKDLEPELVDRTQDSDERVRAALCKLIGSLDYESALHHLSLELLKAIAGRLSDKKFSVRAEAAAALSKLWNAAYPNLVSAEPEAIRQFAWIPEAILQSLPRKDATELRAQMTAVFKHSILPLPGRTDEDQTWVDKVLLVASSLDEDAFKALERLTGLWGFAKGASPYRAFIEVSEEHNGGLTLDEGSVIKARLNYIINHMAVQLFSDHDKAKKDMEAFAAANDPRLYKLFKTCADPQSDVKTLIKARHELLRRLEQSHTDILETFTALVDSASFNIVNQSSISALIKTLQTRPTEETAKVQLAAYKLLVLMAKECPPMFKSHVDELLIVMGDKKNDRLAEVALQALSAVCKVDSQWVPTDRKTLDRAAQMALNGTPRQAKFASRFIANTKDKDAATDLMLSIMDRITNRDEKRLLSYLRALAELALSAGAVFEEKAEEITRFVLDNVMSQKGNGEKNESSDIWVPEEDLAIRDRAKLTGMRILTHRALAFARAEDNLAAAKPILELLSAVLRNDGCVNEDTNEPGPARPHLRLRAALCMLKMANVRSFDKSMAQHFEELGYVLQDPVFQVRHDLLAKLGKILPAQRLSSRWNVLPCMMAMDVEPENIALAKVIMSTVIRACSGFHITERIDRIEVPLARLLLMLTHHPDFECDPAGLKNISKFIELYLDSYANRENVGLLYHIANKVKTVKDISVEDSTTLYKLAELAQIIIRNRADAHHWVLNTFPGKVRLPRDVFHNLTDNTEVLRISRQTFLSEDVVEWARNLGRKTNVAGPSRRVIEPPSSPKRRVKPAAKSTKTSAKKRSKKADVDEDEESSDESDEDAEMASASEQEDEDEEEEGEEVLGRGGKRGAKTKANKAVKRRRVKKAQNEMEVDGGENGKSGESDLSDLDE